MSTARHRRITDPSQHDALSRMPRRHYGPNQEGRRFWKRWTNRRERRAEAGDIREEQR